ncbi:MAG: metallophosphoesterase family protein [Candidatus Omnitrophota bacterium]
MRYAILSDIHANLEGLTQVLHTLRNDSIDGYYCLGDIVGYGANPNECIDEIRNVAGVSLAGNHDWAAAGVMPLDYFNDFAREAIIWTRGVLTAGNSSFLGKLQLVLNDPAMTMVHGTLIDPEDFHYMFNSGIARETFQVMKTDVCFVGHTHVAGVFIRDETGGVSFDARPAVSIEKGRKYIVNAGSVGQPRDNNPEAAYCVFDTGAMTVEIKRVVYDIASARRKMLNAGLPRFLAERIIVGR